MKILRFYEEVFDAIICLNAKIPKKKVLRELEGTLLFSADGAADKLFEKGFRPDYIIGDMDSINVKARENKFPGTEIIHIRDQDTNDFEKNLAIAKEQGHNRILVIGFHGGELEHTLNNWSVFMRYSREMNLCIYDKDRYGIPVFEPTRFMSFPNEIVSLIPQPECVLTTKNLKWELNRETLKLGVREGARNRARAAYFELELYSGSLMVFVDSRLPGAPVFEEYD